MFSQICSASGMFSLFLTFVSMVGLSTAASPDSSNYPSDDELRSKCIEPVTFEKGRWSVWYFDTESTISCVKIGVTLSSAIAKRHKLYKEKRECTRACEMHRDRIIGLLNAKENTPPPAMKVDPPSPPSSNVYVVSEERRPGKVVETVRSPKVDLPSNEFGVQAPSDVQADGGSRGARASQTLANMDTSNTEGASNAHQTTSNTLLLLASSLLILLPSL